MLLAIETSCDETAAAVLEIKDNRFKVYSNVVSSSVKLQAKYGGIVPEVAARKQMEYLIPVIEKALAGFKNKSIDYIAVTNGPGLISSLRVGFEAAKTLSFAWQKPLITVNHMEGHIYSALLNNFQFSIFNFQKLGLIRFPALALLVSGGHTQLILSRDYLKYKIIGETLDDAVGEAFDKVAKMLNLGYPGGPIIAELAAKGKPGVVALPKPMLKSGDYNFSFSGLKTAVLYKVKNKRLTQKDKQNICAAFQQAAVEVLVEKTTRAVKEFKIKTVLLGGGVSANNELRLQLLKKIKENFKFVEVLVPEIKLTGDNALMIALAGYYKAQAGKLSDWRKIKVDPNLRL
jgi:N6-L-threonylcarbamoyladenine synthase